MKGRDAASDVLGGVSQVSAAIVESPAARPAFGAKAVDIGPRLDIGVACRGKEAGKTRAERLNIAMAPIAMGETVVKHPIGGQPAHLDEPIDDTAGSGDREAALAEGQGQYAHIDVVGKAAIEAQFLLGIAPPGGKGPKIDPAVTHWFFEFVDVPIGQEHPGEMGFDPLNPRRALGIGTGRTKKRHLAVNCDISR